LCKFSDLTIIKVTFHGFVENAVVPDQSVGHIHTAHASVVVHHSVRNGNILGLPHNSLFHFPPDNLSTEGLVHGGAHGHFTGVHPLHKQEFAFPYPPQISPFSLFRKGVQLSLWKTNSFLWTNPQRGWGWCRSCPQRVCSPHRAEGVAGGPSWRSS